MLLVVVDGVRFPPDHDRLHGDIGVEVDVGRDVARELVVDERLARVDRDGQRVSGSGCIELVERRLVERSVALR